jgi:SAM-dependent methyltransferase
VYTCELARYGLAVDAMDLSARLTDIARQSAKERNVASRVRHFVGDARDLSMLRGSSYDAALIMGPLYHLVYEEDRRLVLRQVQYLLKPGGIVFSAFISRLGIWGDLLKDIPELIDDCAEVRAVLDNGRDREEYRGKDFRAYYTRVEEIAPLHESAGFETLTLVGVEPAISADDESYNRLTEPRRGRWLDLLAEISAEPTIVGASRHLLYIGRRPA